MSRAASHFARCIEIELKDMTKCCDLLVALDQHTLLKLGTSLWVLATQAALISRKAPLAVP